MMAARSLVVSACLLATAGYLAWTARAEGTPVRAPLEQCPLVISDYRGQSLEPFNAQMLAVLGVDEYLNRMYISPRRVPVGLYVGYYTSQREGDTIHSPQNCLPGSGWEPVSSRHLTIPIAGNKSPIEVNRYLIAKGADRQVVLYWYQSHGRVVASEYWAKIFLTLDAIRLNRTDGALVRVITPIRESEADAEREAVEFVQTIFPLLGQYLPS
jgi:EpsI family protein